MKRRTLAVLAGLVMSASGAVTVAAQQQRADTARTMDTATMQGSMMTGMHGAMQGMMPACMAMAGGMGMETGMGVDMDVSGTGLTSPEMLLRMADPLGLTQEQIDRLSAIRDARGASEDEEKALEARRKAITSLQGETPSISAYEQGLREAAAYMVAAQTAVAQAALEARAVLTPDQRSRLDMGLQMMRYMMGSGMMGGMTGSGMMDSGVISGMMGSGMMGGTTGSGMMGGMMGSRMGMHGMRHGRGAPGRR